MIVWAPTFRHFALVVFWYWPNPKWKLWKGYRPGIVGKKWPTLYVGPLKVIFGPV